MSRRKVFICCEEVESERPRSDKIFTRIDRQYVRWYFYCSYIDFHIVMSKLRVTYAKPLITYCGLGRPEFTEDWKDTSIFLQIA